MQTVCLFASDYDSAPAVHQALQLLLALPDYYGRNADALNDCLSERESCPALWYRKGGAPEVDSALELIARVFRANGGPVTELP